MNCGWSRPFYHIVSNHAPLALGNFQKNLRWVSLGDSWSILKTLLMLYIRKLVVFNKMWPIFTSRSLMRRHQCQHILSLFPSHLVFVLRGCICMCIIVPVFISSWESRKYAEELICQIYLFFLDKRCSVLIQLLELVEMTQIIILCCNLPVHDDFVCDAYLHQSMIRSAYPWLNDK